MLGLYRTLPKPWRRRLRHAARRSLRTTCVLSAILGYCIACIGMPVPQAIEKDRSEPFPCANRSCGCASAASCWEECCCFTREQKLAWAVEHGIAIPAWVLKQQPISPQPVKQIAACPHCKPKPAEKTCCVKPTKPAKVKWLLGMMARKCRGQGSDWLSSGAVLPAPPRIDGLHEVPCVERVRAADSLLHSPPLLPPTPPPRLAASQLG